MEVDGPPPSLRCSQLTRRAAGASLAALALDGRLARGLPWRKTGLPWPSRHRKHRVASAARPGHLLLSGRWQVRFRRVGRSGPRCAPPCPPDRSRTSLLLLDPNPALTSPSLARSPDLPAEPEAPFGTIAARYFAAHRPHPCAQPSCRTPTHSKKPLVGRSQLLSLSHHHKIL